MHSWQNGTRCRDGVKLLWCHSHLVWLVFEGSICCSIDLLRNAGEPIATIKAVHTGPNASKASSEDASGLEPVICLARGARVMLTSKLYGQMLTL